MTDREKRLAEIEHKLEWQNHISSDESKWLIGELRSAWEREEVLREALTIASEHLDSLSTIMSEASVYELDAEEFGLICFSRDILYLAMKKADKIK